MATFHWVCNIYVVLLITYLVNGQFFDFDYDSNLCPPYPLDFEDGANVVVPNITIPCIPLPPLNPVAPAETAKATESANNNCTVINPNGSLANGNSLFLILDPKALQAIIQVVEPCNKTSTIPNTGTAPVKGLEPIANPPIAGLSPIPKNTPEAGAVPAAGKPPVVPDGNLVPGNGFQTGNNLIDESAAVKKPPIDDTALARPKRQIPPTGLPPAINPIPGAVPTPPGGLPPPAITPIPGAVPKPPGGLPPAINPIPGAGPLPPSGLPPPVVPPLGTGQPLPVGGANPLPGGGPIGGGVPPTPGASGGLLCDLITLIITLVNAILQFVLNLLRQLIDIIVNLLKNIISSVLGQLLPQLLTTIGQLLDTLLTDILNDVEQLVNATLTDVLGKEALVSQLVEGLLDLAPESQLSPDVKSSVTSLLQGIITDVENLLRDLLGPSDVNAVQLLANVSVALNNTLEELLDDVEKLADDLLTDLLGNSSVVGDLTTDVATLLRDVLGDTVCNVEKLLTNSTSLSGLIVNLLKLIQDLLDDILEDVDKLLVDVLTKVLADKGLLNRLLDNILKLITDLLNNLLAPKLNALKEFPLMKDPTQFKQETSDKLKTIMNIPNIPAPLDFISPLNPLLNDLVKFVENLITNLGDLLTNKNNGLVNTLLKAIENLLDNLLGDLGKEVTVLLGSQLSNSTNVLPSSSLLGPLGTLVTNILKAVVCDSCKVPVPPVTTIPPVTQKPPVTPIPPVDPNPVPCIPFYYPVPPCRDCIEDTLFDNVNDTDSFVSDLNQYQDYINRNVYDGIGDGFGDGLVDSLL